MSNTRCSTWCSLRTLGPVRRCALLLRSAERLAEPCEGAVDLGPHGVWRLRCTWCDITIEQWCAEIDHVTERWRGGEHRNDNLVAACPVCNKRRPRGVRVPVDVLVRKPDLAAGRALGLLWYPDWLPKRLGLTKPPREYAQTPGAIKARRLRQRWREEGLSGTAFPFGDAAASPGPRASVPEKKRRAA